LASTLIETPLQAIYSRAAKLSVFSFQEEATGLGWKTRSKMLQPLCGNMFASSSSTKAAEAVI
jgi:hypothetical protein